MKFITCKQGTPDWLAARAGAITASVFADAVSLVGALDEKQQLYVSAIFSGATPKDAAIAAGYKAPPSAASVARVLAGGVAGVQSDVSKRYAYDIAIERISKKPYGEPPKAWILDRGHILEAQARIIYESRTGLIAEESGIVKTDDDWFGYSTDGFVDDDGLIEIKCPIDSQKIMAMLKTGDISEYEHQIQGGMWITGRKWCDFIMYVPDLECIGGDLFCKRIGRDEKFIEELESGLIRFRDSVIEAEAFFRGLQAA